MSEQGAPPREVARAGFVDGAVYERGRTEYDDEAVSLAVDALALGTSPEVLDLAAGTGKLTRRLLTRAGSVVAVEPQQQMRATLAARAPGARILDGAAEAIPLAGATVDAVFVGDAFHWFELLRALDEIARVLRPGGGLAVFVRRPLTEELAWWRAAVTATEPHRHAALGPDRPHEVEPWRDALVEDHRFASPSRRELDREHAMSVDDLVAYVESWSFVRAAPAEERARVLSDVRTELEEVRAQQGGDRLAVTWRTDVTTARLLPFAPT